VLLNVQESNLKIENNDECKKAKIEVLSYRNRKAK